MIFLPECTSIVPDGTSRAYPALQLFMLRAVDPARSCLEEAEVQDVRKHLERRRDDIVARLRDFQGGAPRVRRLHRAQATAGVSRGRDVRFLPGTHRAPVARGRLNSRRPWPSAWRPPAPCGARRSGRWTEARGS